MTLHDQQASFAADVALLILHINTQGYTCTLGDAFRTEEQAAIYAKTGKGIKNSLHCKRLAIDLNIFDPNGKYLTGSKDYESFGKYWEALDIQNRSGSFFKKPDGNHFERREM